MKDKIRVAFIYKGSHVFFSGKHFDNTYYHFFMDALRRNERIEIGYFPVESIFDVTKLNGKFDIILLFGNRSWEIADELKGIHELGLPVIVRLGDAHKGYHEAKMNHTKYKIDYYFGFMHENYFYKYYPKEFKYKTIIFGLEPSLYQNVTPFNQRIKNKILNSGAIGNLSLYSRVINKFKKHIDGNSFYGYRLRTLCTKLPYVDYTSTLEHEYVGDNYPKLLQKYRSAIAATTFTPTIKYWEIPAAGCLTFMEITEQNMGEYLGFVDYETAIFINEKNYKEKFMEYLLDVENPKWEKIANAGREHALNNLNNDKAVDTLVDLMEEIIK